MLVRNATLLSLVILAVFYQIKVQIILTSFNKLHQNKPFFKTKYFKALQYTIFTK